MTRNFCTITKYLAKLFSFKVWPVMYLGMQSIKYMCISLCNKQQWQCSDSVFYKLVIVVLDIQIIIPSSSKLMLYFFQFLVLGTCDYRPFTFFRLFWELYFSSFFSIFGRNFLLCAKCVLWIVFGLRKVSGNIVTINEFKTMWRVHHQNNFHTKIS